MNALKQAVEGVREGAFPGGQIGVLYRGRAFSAPFGSLRFTEDSPPVTTDTIYDLASLTKVLSTTALAMQMVCDDQLGLDASVGSLLPELADAGLKSAKVEDLLAHCAGFPAWKPLYQAVPRKHLGTIKGREIIFRALFNSICEYEPGKNAIYSDLDMMLLGAILERIGGAGLDEMARQRVFAPLNMTRTAFRPLLTLPDVVCAPTQRCSWRGRQLVGEVDDENTYAAGGVLGQSGLFGNADDLLKFCDHVLRVLDGRDGIWDRKVLAKFTQRRFPDSNISHCLGFDGKSLAASKLPDAFSDQSIGHWGFTGTGMWIDPAKKRAAILLTNRIHPTRHNTGIERWRPNILAACFPD